MVFRGSAWMTDVLMRDVSRFLRRTLGLAANKSNRSYFNFYAPIAPSLQFLL